MSYDDDYTPEVTGHQTEHGFAFTVEVRPPNPDDITEALARRMLAEYSSGDKIKKMVANRFAELVRELVDERAKEAISEAMGMSRQPTDEFGNPVGAAKTFAQMLGEQVKAWQEETVDQYNGQRKAKDAYSNNNVITRSQYLIRQVGAHEFEKLAKEEVQKVRADAKRNIDATIKASVASAIQALAAK